MQPNKTYFVEQAAKQEERFRRANSGVVFEFHQKDNPGCSPVIFLLASDASFSGQHRAHHPIYRK
jgi:hypothetical protein